MLWVPQKGIVKVEHNFGAVGASPPGTLVAGAASASGKGAAVELIAATSFESYFMQIKASHYGVAGVASQGAMDIMIGAATEQIIIPNLLMGYAAGNNSSGPKVWSFPLYIPAGSRITAQSGGARTTNTVAVGVTLFGGDGIPKHRAGTRVTTYGMGTSPNGTAITPGASGAEGSWTEITASTSRDHFALFPSFQITGDTATNDRYYFLDIGVGAATEEEVAQSYIFGADANEQMSGPFPNMPTFIDVPAGTRLTMRVSNSGTNEAGYNGVIHAVS